MKNNRRSGSGKRKRRQGRRKKTWLGTLIALLLMAAAAVPAVEKGSDKTSEYGTAEETVKTASQEYSQEMTGQEEVEAQVHFIDVGQGDATLIKCGGDAMLIDAGENDKGTAVQLYLQKQGVEKLKYLVLTHPDSDHIGGADVIITKFEIEKILMPDHKKDSRTYEDVVNAMKAKSETAYAPQVGEVYPLGGGSFTILAPDRDYKDSNNSSIALRFCLGEVSFLFTGDAEKEAEDDMLQNGLFLCSDVYKAGHHGSSSASSEEFLKMVDAGYAVISCGEDNSYGHPHAEVLNRMRGMGMKVYRTDEQGSIVAETDGKEITWNAAPSETWKSGERKG